MDEDCSTLIQKYSGKDTGLSAIALNKAGYDLYKRKNYQEALKLFCCSVKYDENYQYGHYYFGCALALLFGMNQVVNTNEMFSHL